MKDNAYVNFDYLKELTTGNTEGMIVMLKAYLEETPRLLDSMRDGVESSNWDTVKNAAHSMLPSFPMLGMKKEYENMAREIQDLAHKKENLPQIKALYTELKSVCDKALTELQNELDSLSKK
jgi:HPt (histidine-containing phosphotransfer) domain-containing protein